MKKQALFCIALAGTLMVGGCGQKATDSTAGTAQVTETSDSAPADKPDGVETSPKVESQIEINKRSWEGVHAGMELYTQSTGIFDGFPISVAGKSGTAQEVKNRPDHGLFIGYAPADDPEIAVAVRIVNGYEAGNAVECGKNIFEYYFGIE